MKVGYYIKKEGLNDDPRVLSVLSGLSSAGVDVYPVPEPSSLLPATDMLLSFGGDGTFLCAARRAAEADVPVLGVNLGRLGFLSENPADGIVESILAGKFTLESREMLAVEGFSKDGFWPYALNEVCLSRIGSATLGVDVRLGDTLLPTYWADGLLVATSSGSTAYNLSAGGPICTPDAGVTILTPVAPHNLNLRPLVIPAGTPVSLSFHSRDGVARLSLDNRAYELPDGAGVKVVPAHFRLKRVVLEKSNFFQALESRFFWGQDVRNNSEK